MNLITRNNYEAYFLDYVEENLSPELIAELMLFLENNPDLKEDLDEFEIHNLIPSKIILSEKDKFKKTENSVSLNNYEDLIIAEIEGENSTETSAALYLFLENNPKAQSDFNTYQKTKLAAPTIVFEHKKSIKKKEGKVIPMYWWYSSAAAVIIILFLIKGFNFNDNIETNPIANEEKEIIIKEAQKDPNIEKRDYELEENNLANVDMKIAPKNIKQKNKKKTTPKIIVPQKEVLEINLADKSQEEIKDSILPAVKDEKPIEEFFYSDNVVITYEDDAPIKDEIKTPPSRFKIIKEILNQRVKKKFLQQEKDKNGETTAYAINVAGVGFSKGKKKNKQ